MQNHITYILFVEHVDAFNEHTNKTLNLNNKANNSRLDYKVYTAINSHVVSYMSLCRLEDSVCINQQIADLGIYFNISS